MILGKTLGQAISASCAALPHSLEQNAVHRCQRQCSSLLRSVPPPFLTIQSLGRTILDGDSVKKQDNVTIPALICESGGLQGVLQYGEAQLFGNLANQRFARIFSPFQLPARKFPQAAMMLVHRPLLQQ